MIRLSQLLKRVSLPWYAVRDDSGYVRAADALGRTRPAEEFEHSLTAHAMNVLPRSAEMLERVRAMLRASARSEFAALLADVTELSRVVSHVPEPGDWRRLSDAAIAAFDPRTNDPTLRYMRCMTWYALQSAKLNPTADGFVAEYIRSSPMMWSFGWADRDETMKALRTEYAKFREIALKGDEAIEDAVFHPSRG